MRYLKDLILTDTFLVRGHLNTGGKRLSTFLNSTSRRFLEMNEAAAFNHAEGERFSISQMLVRVDEILLAHEMEVTGDEGLRFLAEREKDWMTMTARFTPCGRLHLSGKASRRALDRDTPGHHSFIVVIEPKLEGIRGKSVEECAVFNNLPYVIANRNRFAFVLL